MDDVTRLLGLVVNPAGRPLRLPEPAALLRRARRRAAARTSAGVVAAVVGVLAVAVPVGLLEQRQAGAPAAPPSSSSPAQRGTVDVLSRARWIDLPTAPIRGRSYAASAWTGSEMLVWGGIAPSTDARFDDGAAYDPRTDTWQKLPDGPLEAVTSPMSVWTGEEMVIVGGQGAGGAPVRQMASYRPDRQAWRSVELPASLFPTDQTAVVWSGKAVVLLGLRDSGSFGKYAPLRVASWDPATNEWTRLSDLPVRPTTVRVVAETTNGRIAAVTFWSGHMPGSNDGTPFGTEMHVLDGQRWQPVPLPTGFGVDQLLATSAGLIATAASPFFPAPSAIQRDLHGWIYRDGTWDALPHGPADDLLGTSVWTGSALVTANTGTYSASGGLETLPGVAAALDPSSRVWTTLTSAPAQGYDAAVVWAGDRLLVWGLLHERSALAPGQGPSTAKARGMALTAASARAPESSAATPPCKPARLQFTSYIDGRGQPAAAGTPGTATRYHYDDGAGTSFSKLVPPAGWRPVGATDAELAAFGFAPRPRNDPALSSWNRDYANYKGPETPPDEIPCANDSSYFGSPMQTGASPLAKPTATPRQSGPGRRIG